MRLLRADRLCLFCSFIFTGVRDVLPFLTIELARAVRNKFRTVCVRLEVEESLNLKC